LTGKDHTARLVNRRMQFGSIGFRQTRTVAFHTRGGHFGQRGGGGEIGTAGGWRAAAPAPAA